MKRYDITGCRSTRCSMGMAEFEDGDYVRWDDLIAAGVLVPVPDGEACLLSKLPVEFAAFTHDGDLYIYEGMTCDWLGFNVTKLRWVQLSCDTIVQPVRLEDVG